jgi:hypothetical protein
MEETLSTVQLVCIPSQWPSARSKLLRLFNNYNRTLRQELDINLEIDTEKEAE